MTPRGLADRFSQLDLTRQFVLAGSVVAVLAMLAIGQWVSGRIAGDAVDSAAAATALYMDSFIAPLAQELQTEETLSIGPIRALDEVLETPPLQGRVVSIKIWKTDGTVAYARDIDLMGKRFAPSPSLLAALQGETVAELDSLDDAESADEAAAGIPLLEIYSPVRAAWTGDIIAVAEFYEDASALTAQIRRARLQGWLVTAAITLLIGLSLTGIVHRGSKLIAGQRVALAAKVAESERITEQNRTLRLRAERTSRRIAELNELNLRRIGADLHDGVAQLIGFAALRLDAVRGGRSRNRDEDLREIAEVLNSAMEEIRQTSRGLMLPELDNLDLQACIERAIGSHEKRTGTTVARHLDVGGVTVTDEIKVCVYRFVQEGLNNAFRHGGGLDQAVRAGARDVRLALEVRNSLPEGHAAAAAPVTPGLGLSGLRERVGSLGGSLTFAVDGTGGATLAMEIALVEEALDD